MGADNVFSVPIFLIILRESIEAGIIVSILLAFVKQLMEQRGEQRLPTNAPEAEKEASSSAVPAAAPEPSADAVLPTAAAAAVVENIVIAETHLTEKQLYRKLVWQIWLGTIIGFGIALGIGAAFIAVFYTKLTDLWAQTEDLWEGGFSLIAAGIILMMGIAFLKLEGSSVKWKIKLAHAFENTNDKQGRGGRYALLLLPMITVLREGLEAVIFVGGVSLGQSPTSIPLAVVVGLMCGAIISYLIYRGGAVVAIRYFLIVSTCILFMVGAGLFSKACGYFQTYVFNYHVGADVEELGDGPGSFNVVGNVWHLTYGNPENTQTGGGWSIFNAILGWTNTATVGTITCYCAYWMMVIITLVYLKWKEGRTKLFGWSSKAYKKRHEREMARKQERMSQGLAESDDEKGSISVESPA